MATRYGLIGAGAAGRSLLARLPSLHWKLGPVASPSVKVAGRIANLLKCGRAARDMSGFADCAVVLVCAPDTGLEKVVAQLEQARIEWSGKILLFCDSEVSSLDFPVFRELGASVGSLNTVEGLPDTYVIEGDREALRESKRMVKELGGKPLEIDSNRIRSFEAARTISTSLFTPIIDSCVECIEGAGLDRKLAGQIAEALLVRCLRTYMHAGRRGWSGPVASRDSQSIVRQYEEIRKTNALRADYFRQSADFAMQLFQTCPELARYHSKSAP